MRTMPSLGDGHAGQHAHERALAGPVATEDAHRLARVDLEADVLQRQEFVAAGGRLKGMIDLISMA